MLITDYLTLLNQQSAAQPNYSKYTALNLNSYSFPFSEVDTITKILNEAFSYLSVVSIDGALYWEFLNLNNSSYFANFQFLYLQITDSNLQAIQAKLPSFYSYNATGINQNYPVDLYLYEEVNNAFNSYYSTSINTAYTHPFLPYFAFTGKISKYNNSLVYEYIDMKGYYGLISTLYLSTLRPTKLYYPLGYVYPYQWTADTCLETGLYPSEENQYYIGQYTGRFTNDNYCKGITFYEYQFDNNTFLSCSSPISNAEGIGLATLGRSQLPYIKLPRIYGNQDLAINQISTQHIVHSSLS